MDRLSHTSRSHARTKWALSRVPYECVIIRRPSIIDKYLYGTARLDTGTLCTFTQPIPAVLVNPKLHLHHPSLCPALALEALAVGG